jgi:hypothetical protein
MNYLLSYQRPLTTLTTLGREENGRKSIESLYAEC